MRRVRDVGYAESPWLGNAAFSLEGISSLAGSFYAAVHQSSAELDYQDSWMLLPDKQIKGKNVKEHEHGALVGIAYRDERV